MERLLSSSFSISNGSREKFKQQIYCRNWFSARVFYITIADTDIRSLQSLHTLCDKYLDHMLMKFEQNRMVRTIRNFDFFWQKWLTIFDKVLTPFWKTLL